MTDPSRVPTRTRPVGSVQQVGAGDRPEAVTSGLGQASGSSRSRPPRWGDPGHELLGQLDQPAGVVRGSASRTASMRLPPVREPAVPGSGPLVEQLVHPAEDGATPRVAAS